MMKPNTEAIVPANSDINRYAKDPNWLRTWLAMESMPWRSLAVIPMHEGSSLEAVHGLAAVAWEQHGSSVIVADIRSIALAALSAVREETQQRKAKGERVLFACRSLNENPVAATVAREADGIVLCIVLGKSRLKSVTEAIKEIGQERIIGTISLRLSSA
ncbi:MAG TPA: hypothetical protein VIV60_13315 [Polyangiaceae bacterium]